MRNVILPTRRLKIQSGTRLSHAKPYAVDQKNLNIRIPMLTDILPVLFTGFQFSSTIGK